MTHKPEIVKLENLVGVDAISFEGLNPGMITRAYNLIIYRLGQAGIWDYTMRFHSHPDNESLCHLDIEKIVDKVIPIGIVYLLTWEIANRRIIHLGDKDLDLNEYIRLILSGEKLRVFVEVPWAQARITSTEVKNDT